MNIRPLCTFLLCAALADPTHAAIVTATEIDGTSANNSLVPAPAIAGASFTTPVPAEVFNPSRYVTATLEGSNGGDEVDFFSFFANPGWVYLDMDNTNPTFDPPIAHLDGKDRGLAVTGVAPDVATYDFNGTQPGNSFYTLHVSFGTGASDAVPEPATYALSGAALLLIGAIGRRNKSNNQ